MKITIVNTSDIRGGAAIAAFRLFKVLKSEFPETRMIVRDKLTSSLDITGLNNTILQGTIILLRFFFERLWFIIRSKNKEVWFAFSPANTGQDISRLKEIQNADIIHLHWINGGFLSPESIAKLVKTGKPIAWTLHDMWAFTGGCHYSGSCTNFIRNCGACIFLKFPDGKDMSYRNYNKKFKAYNSANISFIAVSNWMAENARKSSLIGKSRIEVIPNPIDTEVFQPGNKENARIELGLPLDKFLILSGAANLMDKRKGFTYLLSALTAMIASNPGLSDKIGLITFGKSSIVYDSPVQVYSQSYLKDDHSVARLYQAADVYVLPTLEDNLPGTVMESLACGIPVVAFNTGGIPDMVDHKSNGYLSELKNVSDLITGIEWVENNLEIELVRNNCRKKVMENFSPAVVAEKYINFYRSLIK